MWLDYFDHVYCIHMPNPERREAIAKQFDSVGITDVTYIHATPPAEGFTMSNMRRGPRGEFGCSLSHIKAAAHALAGGARWPIFFEDDVTFRMGTLKSMRQALLELPYTWEVLYLGGHPRSPAKMVSANLAKVGTFSFAEAYAIKGWALRSWLAFWCDRAGQKNAMVDLVLGEFAAQRSSFCVYPLITYQPPGISQISDKFDDKSGCLNKGWQTNLSTKSASEKRPATTMCASDQWPGTPKPTA